MTGSIGTTELVVILVAALMVFGPRNPRRAHRVGAGRRERSKETRA